jgi:drug/metabolite transporter (DMT)-like permease
MTAITDILIGIVFAAFGQLLFKIGTDNTGQIGLSNIFQIFNIYIILGLVFYGVGSVFWIIALSKADLSFVYPFTALTFVLVCVLSVFILKENLTWNRIAGTAIILLGVTVLFLFEK